jgi:sec-independent protein translocase protein TatB
MFDIGFSEIVVIAVVALVVIGPEKLPKTARTLGVLFGRLQRYVSDVKADISREMELDELRRLQREMQGAARDIEQTVRTAANDVATGVRNVESELNSAATQAAATSAPGTAAASAASTPAASNSAPGIPAAPPASEEPPPRQGALPGFEKI